MQKFGIHVDKIRENLDPEFRIPEKNFDLLFLDSFSNICEIHFALKSDS